MVNTPFELNFRVDRDDEKLCVMQLTGKDQAKFKHAIENDYYFQMYFDQLPLWGFIGKVRGMKTDL